MGSSLTGTNYKTDLSGVTCVCGMANSLEHLRGRRAHFLNFTFFSPNPPEANMADFFEKPAHSSRVELSQLRPQLKSFGLAALLTALWQSKHRLSHLINCITLRDYTIIAWIL